MGIMHKNTPASGLGSPAAAAETVVYTTPAMQVGAGMTPIGISGTLNVTPGTAASQAIVRIRQGSLTGPVVGPAPVHTVAAGAAQSVSFGGTDTTTYLEQVGGGVYVITLQMTSATGASTVNSLDVEVIT